LGNFVFDGPADSTLNSGIALRVLLDHNGVAMVSRRDAPVGRLDAPMEQRDTPTPQQDRSTTDPGAITMWRWSGTTANTLATPAGFRVPPQPTQLSIDLRGNGQPLWARLDTKGVVTLTDGASSDAPVVWTNESSRWRFTHIASGDPNDDGRAELILLLWQQDTTGQLRSQPYLLGWRGGRYHIIWGGSATPTPIQDLAVEDMDHDGRSELVVLEGGQNPGDAGETVSVWHWHGWGFQREWSAPTGRWHSLALADIDHDGQIEIIAVP
ncbi:MAG: VCBS repeat-containing protein, partial [Oscillochloris sp.]|nr:VCBS repeat-containing protein [Oscillochloris sp.]